MAMIAAWWKIVGKKDETKNFHGWEPGLTTKHRI
jgi:hypothetical protein